MRIRTAASGRQDPSVELWRMPTFAHFEILAVMVDRVQAAAGVHEPHAQRHRSREGLSRRAYGEGGTAGRSTPVVGQRQGRGVANREDGSAAAWGWPSAVPLWGGMAGSCGQAPTTDEVQPFISLYRSGSCSHRPRLPKVFRSSSEYFY
jgi:hypothetical protein